MRRRDLSDEELTTVINLKQAGTTWVKIQAETGINRRTAKRAYEKWTRSQSLKELKEARRDVAAQAFREHMESLIRLAASLVTNLSVPFFLTDMEKNAKQFFSWLYELDLLYRGDYLSPEPIQVGTGDTQCFYVGDRQSSVLKNQLLFKSLKVHTREEVRWEVLHEWERARDKCAKIVPKLRQETSEMVNNFINQEQEREANFLQRVKEDSQTKDPAKKMAEAVLRDIWRDISFDKLEEEGPWFQTISKGKGPHFEIYVRSRDGTVLDFTGMTDKNLPDKVTRICNLAANNLRRGQMAKLLTGEVRTIKKGADELREMLNPVKLTPMILRTRCDLCPA